jgi:hypothetical protein
MEKNKYRLPKIISDTKSLGKNRSSIIENILSLEKNRSSIVYQKFTENQSRKKRNDLNKLKKEILKNFKFELQV